jgi:hypothetical protein
LTSIVANNQANCRQVLFTNTVPTNSGPHADRDQPDNAADQAADESAAGGNQPDFGDAGPLQRSQDAIDQSQEAAREALKDTPPEERGEAPAG